jgi:hypothetical protein
VAIKKAPKRQASKASAGAYLAITDLVRHLPPKDRSLALSALADVACAIQSGDARSLAAIRDAAWTSRLSTESRYLALQRICEAYLADEGPYLASGERPDLRRLRAADAVRSVRELGFKVTLEAVLLGARRAKNGRQLAVDLLAVSDHDRRADETDAAHEKRMARVIRDAQPSVRGRRNR